MDENERDAVLTKLRDTRDDFLSAVDGVRADQAAWKPAPERWSILECAEHVALVEKRMFDRVTKEVTPRAGGSTGAGPEQDIFARGADRSRKIQAPAVASPTGRFATLAEAVQAFELERSETIRWAEDCLDDLRALQTSHPTLGELTAQECLALLIIHPARHALQVRELREHSQFPQ